MCLPYLIKVYEFQPKGFSNTSLATSLGQALFTRSVLFVSNRVFCRVGGEEKSWTGFASFTSF
jgi:hypothetical protein